MARDEAYLESGSARGSAPFPRRDTRLPSRINDLAAGAQLLSARDAGSTRSTSRIPAFPLTPAVVSFQAGGRYWEGRLMSVPSLIPADRQKDEVYRALHYS
jgi:hypothetical protein